MALSHKLKNNKYIELMEYKYLESFKILLKAKKNARRTRKNRLRYRSSKW